MFTLLSVERVKEIMDSHLVSLSLALSFLRLHRESSSSRVIFQLSGAPSYLFFGQLYQLDTSLRSAQKLLASEVTELVHGGSSPPSRICSLFLLLFFFLLTPMLRPYFSSRAELGLQRALTATSVLYQTDLNLLSADAVLSAFTNDPRLVRVPRSSFPLDLARLAGDHKVAGSRSASLSLSLLFCSLFSRAIPSFR